MTRSLIKRISKLEAAYTTPKLVRSPLVMLVGREQEGALAPGERVVEDWFRNCGSIVWARERVTTDTDDVGRRCPPGGYLLDVLEDFHDHCPWRARTGVCQMCERTPVGKEEPKMNQNRIELKRAQREVFLSPHRFRLLVAGRRFGKTYLANVELFRAASGAGRKAWYVAPTYRQAKRIAWAPLKELTRPYSASKPQESDLRIELQGGGTIALRGADSYDSLRGEGLDFVMLDEYASMAPAAWNEVLRPALADRKGGALFIGAPRGFNHFYDVYEGAQSQPDWASFHFSNEEGGNVAVEELQSAARELDERVYRQEFRASFENLTSGRVYYAFDRVKPVEYDPRFPLCWSLDFNIDPASSVLCQIVHGHVSVLDEIVLRDASTYDVCQEFARRTKLYVESLERGRSLAVSVYGDATGESRRSAASRTDRQIVRDFFASHSGDYNAAFKVRSRNPELKDRINCVNAIISNANGERSLTVSPKCKQLIRDLQQVSWKSDANGNPIGDLSCVMSYI